MSRYKFKIGDLVGIPSRVRHRRRASSRIARAHIGENNPPPQAPRHKAFVEISWPEASLLQVLVALVVLLMFAALVIALIWPNSLGNMLPKTPFTSPDDVIDDPPQR